MEETLNIWKERLEKLGFSYKYYDNFCGEIIGVDWYKDKEHIKTVIYYTEDYVKHLRSLNPKDEYELNWDKCIVYRIIIYTQEFGYPKIYRPSSDKFKGMIDLSQDCEYTNFTSLTYENFCKALYMSQHPIESKISIVKGFIQECEIFFNKYAHLLEEFNLKQTECSLLLVGQELDETEPYICFQQANESYSYIDFQYNIFTNKLIFKKYKSNLLQSYSKFEIINVNDISYDEFKNLLNDAIEK